VLTGRDNGPALRALAMQAMRDEVSSRGLSSAHITFDLDGGDSSGWLERFDWQFHWSNPPAPGSWRDFEDFLGALSAKKRKNIRQERAQVARAGIKMRRISGRDASAAELAAMFDFYLATFSDKGNLPVLTLDFLHHLAHTLPDQLLLVLAERAGDIIAGALFLHSGSTLYGRYWGSHEALPGLHFETCYYQGIEFCLANDIRHFEPGAQGEHKLARGFLPTRTRSLHHIADPRFRSAIADALTREASWQLAYRDQLMQHSPYRDHAAAPAST
jgi:predicted N-acyltransferase